MKRILFFAESATLAHRMRPHVLASVLEGSKYVVGFAAGASYGHLFKSRAAQHFEITSLRPQDFQRALWYGRPLYSEDFIDFQVKEDLALFEKFRPDVVVSDFRLSNKISAKVYGVPLINLTNSYWQRKAEKEWDVPESFYSHVLGIPLCRFLFKNLSDLFLQPQREGFQRCAKRWRVSEFAHLSLSDIYTQGDLSLFCDVPSLVPSDGSLKGEILGPLLWNPDLAPPAWWKDLEGEKSALYLNLGSSGKSSVVPLLLDWLLSMNLKLPIVVGGTTLSQKSQRQTEESKFVYNHPVVPGLEVCRRSQLMICNGGSPSVQQAFSEGLPVLGVTGNIDQMLHMSAVRDAGAGLLMRSDQLRRATFCEAVERLLGEPSFKVKAQSFQREMSEVSVKANFEKALGHFF